MNDKEICENILKKLTGFDIGLDQYALWKNLADDTIAKLYVTKLSTISFHLTKLYVT